MKKRSVNLENGIGHPPDSHVESVLDSKIVKNLMMVVFLDFVVLQIHLFHWCKVQMWNGENNNVHVALVLSATTIKKIAITFVYSLQISFVVLCMYIYKDLQAFCFRYKFHEFTQLLQVLANYITKKQGREIAITIALFAKKELWSCI